MMKGSSTEVVIDDYAQELLYAVLENPVYVHCNHLKVNNYNNYRINLLSIASVFEDVSTVCQLLTSCEKFSTKSYLLRFLCALVLNHNR